ncbi:MAG: TonB-dependent receptor [Candidatus Aminicenantes bacterium]|nr:MAG: TonB-dependent receptor [Candidatus Aminicenantes bacterium]
MKNKEKYSVFMVILFVMVLSLVTGEALLVAETSGPPGSSSQAADKAGEKEDKNKEKEVKEPELYYEVTVTATRTKKDTFEIPKAVSVVDRKKIEEKAPNNITELLTELPGVDMNGVGANQSRPIIRGFRGQRILLMEDGIRMNNSRRQQDFGEIPALVDISEVDRVEVVRGPASVLYGSDAIGGVVNIITRVQDYDPETSKIHGNFGYRYSSADKQNKGIANINGNAGKLGFMLSGNYRNAKDYTAPAGTFGAIELTEDVPVNDTGVKDGGINLLLTYSLSKQNQISFKYEYYHSENAGFGFIEPEIYDPGSTRIQIRYPMQEVQKYTLKYENRRLGFALADHLGFTAYYLNNQRELTNDIFVPFNIPWLPGAGISIQTENYTDVNTMGFRLEFNKAAKNHTITYGMDLFRDKTENTDTSITQMVGFGPPSPTIDNTPKLPHARYRSFGVFIQDDISLFTRTSLILGLRYQNVNAKTKETPGLEGESLVDSTDETFVGTANLLLGITRDLRLVLSVGRGFRSPNLIERFFNGITPEGSGFQSRNTGLKAETSLNLDVGFKFRRKNVHLEATFFNNVVRDGIRLTATGNEVNEMPEYQNINVDKLRMQGIEALGRVFFKFGLSAMANITYIKSKDLGNPETPYVDTYSSKFNLNVRYDHPKRLFWVGYDLRANGDQKDVILVENPIGDIIPGFVVHSLSAGITLFKNSSFPQQLGIIIGNLTNTLYSEFSNASFFRPAPKRHFILTWSTRF